MLESKIFHRVFCEKLKPGWESMCLKDALKKGYTPCPDCIHIEH